MQGHTQTMAIAELFHIDEVHVYDISPEASRKYAEDMKDTVQGKIVIAKTPEEAATGADVVVCVTQSKDKFVKDSWIKPGGILFPMGSYQECEDAYILNADRIIVDHVGQCLHRGALKELSEAGKITEKDIYATIGEIVAGKKKGPGSPSERTLCIPIGTGAMDIAVATIALKKAEERGSGSYEFAWCSRHIFTGGERMTTLLVTQKEIAELVSMAEVIDAVEKPFGAWGRIGHQPHESPPGPGDGESGLPITRE